MTLNASLFFPRTFSDGFGVLHILPNLLTIYHSRTKGSSGAVLRSWLPAKDQIYLSIITSREIDVLTL